MTEFHSCFMVSIPLYIYIYLYLYLSIYLYMYTHTHREYLLYPFIYWWTLGLLPYLGYCKEWCYEHWDKYIFSKWCFHFFPVIFPRVELLGHIVVLFLVFEHLHTVFPEKAMASHSRTLAWRIPWMEEPGRLQPMGLLRVGRDWATWLSLFTFTQWRRKWQPTPVFLPGELQGQQSLVGCRLWGRTESDTTEAT